MLTKPLFLSVAVEALFHLIGFMCIYHQLILLAASWTDKQLIHKFTTKDDRRSRNTRLKDVDIMHALSCAPHLTYSVISVLIYSVFKLLFCLFIGSEEHGSRKPQLLE